MIFGALLAMAAGMSDGSSYTICDGEYTTVQQISCATRAYRAADQDLNAAYRDLVQQLRGDGLSITSLQNSERAWITFRDAHCRAKAEQYRGGSIAPYVQNICLREVTIRRTQELRNFYEPH